MIISLLSTPAVAGDGFPFNGQDLSGWTNGSGDPVGAGWTIEDGVIYLNRQAGRAGNILTSMEFGDFDLSFEFKIAAGGNSGLKYRVTDFGGRTLGCEYQILDEPGSVPNKGSTGSLYDVYQPDAQAYVFHREEYNSARIVVSGDRIQHWLNGRLVVSANVGDAEWNHLIAESKFSDVEGFGRNQYGKIMLTDHGSEVWYRNFRFQPLEMAPAQWVAAGAANGFYNRCNQLPRRRAFGGVRLTRRGWFRRR